MHICLCCHTITSCLIIIGFSHTGIPSPSTQTSIHTYLEVSRKAVQQGDYDESNLVSERSLHFSVELELTVGDLREGRVEGWRGE